MNRALPFLLAMLVVAPTSAAAQMSRPLVKDGKWVALAASIGFNIAAADAHNDANRSFDRIDARCAAPNALRCELEQSGRYVDPVTEQLYQETLALDEKATRWLIAGEAALLGATALFVWELTRSVDSPPDNEPFAPVVQQFSNGVGLGFQIRF